MFYGVIHEPGCGDGWLQYNPPYHRSAIQCRFCHQTSGGFHVIELRAEYYSYRNQEDQPVATEVDL